MEASNRSLIYWKWDDGIFDADIEKKVDDLCLRTKMGSVFVALHWIKKPIDDPALVSLISRLCDMLHARGRKLYIEACPRNEAGSFEQISTDACYLTRFYELELDLEGNGALDFTTETTWHYWRSEKPGRGKLISAFAISKTGPHNFLAGSENDISDKCLLKMAETDANGNSLVSLNINAGPENAGKTAVVFYGARQAIPDIASKDLKTQYAQMLKSLSHIPLDGVCSDEWGFDVILEIEKTTNYYNDVITMRHISVSDALADEYHADWGRGLETDLLHMFYASSDCDHKGYTARSGYFNTLRRVMAQNDEDMYKLAKETFGPNTFFGVHPTWWGSEDQQYFEFIKNGFYWWEARRDIAQTDEMVILPIRTALAHKWRSPYWYNMWYSMGTRDIDTYYKETWRNILYGGRTHYLGYECPNENVVLELHPEGMLEAVEEMDARVRLLDSVQNTQPDCRVLVLFSIEAAQSWPDGISHHPPFGCDHSILRQILCFAKNLFDHYLCDLVPTSEIRNGSLKVVGQKAVYGSQCYDAVILVAPDLMKKSYFDYIRSLDASRFTTMGRGNRYSDGQPYSDADRKIIKDIEISEEAAIDILKNWEIAPNRSHNGVVYQDGSIIFSALGDKPSGNALVIDQTLGQKDIKCECEDFLYISADGKKTTQGTVPCVGLKIKR